MPQPRTNGERAPILRPAGYQPHLDGLRALAVYLVVVFHAGWGAFAGGYVGVDVFFVLSGFLVTRLLLRDAGANGSIGFRSFYARRFRRLLPAAFVTLIVTAVVFSAIASPVEVVEAVGGFKASFLYAANWYFIAQSADYFGTDVEANPVVHFWSLAVEEQFYLIWPVLLTAVLAINRRLGSSRRPLQAMVAVGAVASLGWALALRNVAPTRAYFGTDTRAYQLLLGALVALAPGLVLRVARHARAARWSALLLVSGVVVVATRGMNLEPISRGAATAVLTAAALVTLDAGGDSALRRGLSWAPIVYLGQISYGTYLWHWPVIVVIARSFDLSAASTVQITIVIATGLASLSYQLMEHPIRASYLLDSHRSGVIAVGLTISVVAALVVVPAIADRATTHSPATMTADPATSGFGAPPANVDWTAVATDYPESPNCEDGPSADCTLVRGAGSHLLLVGDSHAGMLIPAFRAIADELDLTLSVSARAGCPWQRALFRIPRGGVPQPIDACKRYKDDLYERVVPELDPDVVVLVNADYPERGLPFVDGDGEPLDEGSARFESYVAEATGRSLEELGQEGRRIVIIEPIPVSTKEENPIPCLSTATVVAECRYVVDPSPSPIEEVYRATADDGDGVWSADLDRLVCPFLPICDPIIGSVVVQMDGFHLSTRYAAVIAPNISAYLTENGIVAG